MRKVAEDAIAQWREREPDSDLNHYSEVQLDQFVSNFYLGKLFSGYTQIDRDFCEDMTNEEYRAYQWVEKNLKNQMPAKHMDTENADMRDALCALTANKIRNTFGDITHRVEDFWDYSGQTPKWKPALFTEAWAEYFAANMLGENELMEINTHWFPNLCRVFDEETKKVRTIFEEAMLPIYYTH